MRYEALLKRLHHPDARMRIITADILRMVDEVRALGDLKTQLKRESHPRAQDALHTAHMHLQALRDEGYDTLDAICHHFGVYRELQWYLKQHEDDMAKSIGRQVRGKDHEKSPSMIDVARIAGPLGGVSFGTGASTLSSNLGDTAEKARRDARRRHATAPTHDNILAWRQRLQASEDMGEKITLLAQLANSHNPVALISIVRMFVTDDDTTVRDRARHLGRMLYWNNQYWYLSEDGTIDHLMELKAMEYGVEYVPAKARHPSVSAASQENLDEIVRQAEQKRHKRGKRL